MRNSAKIALAASAAISFASAGCATEEIPPYGDPARVVAGAGPSGGASGGGSCTPQASCSVNFDKDVMPILDGPAKCSATVCHGGSKGGITLMAGDVFGTLNTLRDLELKDENLNLVQYIAPCDPASSYMLCNLQLASGPGPYGTCGSLMPKVDDDGVDDVALTDAEFKVIEDWIKCGAPSN
jgi:hypothetical protein